MYDRTRTTPATQQFLLMVTACLLLFASCSFQASTGKELEVLKTNLFNTLSDDITRLPIYAHPPTSDFDDVRKGIFTFQIDSVELNKILQYRSELEPDIISRLDSGYSWVYLAAYLRYQSAVPRLKAQLLACEKFYGWEGPDYSDIESYLKDDEQYCYQMAYIAAIECITGKPITNAITLTQKEYTILKIRSDKCTDAGNDSVEIYCSARWLLGKLNPK